jgi:hypothetical protein
LLVSGKFKDDASSATSCEHYLCAEFCSLGQVALNYLICKGALPIAGYVTSTFSPKLQMGFFASSLIYCLVIFFYFVLYKAPFIILCLVVKSDARMHSKQRHIVKCSSSSLQMTKVRVLYHFFQPFNVVTFSFQNFKA